MPEAARQGWIVRTWHRLHPCHPVQQLLHRERPLHPGQGRPRARAVRPRRPGGCAVGVETEAVGVLVDGLVAVGRGDPHLDPVAGVQRHPADRRLPRAATAGHLDRRVHAERLLHVVGQERPIAGQPVEEVGVGAASIPLIDPPSDTETAKTAKVVSTFTFPSPNETPAETWASGFRTPYGLAFSPSGELWEVEHGPRGGDELNLIQKGKNYGWPLVSFGNNYNGVPIPKPDSRPDLTAPVIYWVPVIAPGNIMFYRGTQTFPQWNGNGFISGLGTTSLNRIVFDGHGGAKTAERWNVGKRIRDVEEGPDGSLWMLEDANPGALIHVTPK